MRRDEAALCAGERKARARREEVACRGERVPTSLVDKENAPVVGEKHGAGWLADKLAKGALEVGGALAPPPAPLWKQDATRRAHLCCSDVVGAALTGRAIRPCALCATQRIWRRSCTMCHR